MAGERLQYLTLQIRRPEAELGHGASEDPGEGGDSSVNPTSIHSPRMDKKTDSQSLCTHKISPGPDSHTWMQKNTWMIILGPLGRH